MAIVPLRNMTLIGELKHRAAVMSQLQRLGCVHVDDLTDGGAHPTGRAIHHDDLKGAIGYLERCPEKRPAASQVVTDEEIKGIVAETLQLESHLRDLAEEHESISEQIAHTLPWGDFQMPAAEVLRGRQLYFYRLPHRQVKAASQEVNKHGVAHVVSTDRHFEYWLVIAQQPLTKMPCDPEQLDPRPLSQLQSRLAEIEQAREQLQLQRLALTRWLEHLRARSAAILDETARLRATQRGLIDGPIFVLQGWVAARRLVELKAFAADHGLVLRSRPPRAAENPPTLLSNPRPISGAEGAVTFFMTPGYRAWDPTWVMFVSFAAFFAMILADAGYGLVLAGILAIVARSLGSSESGRRFRQLAVFMVAVTIVYGVLIGSYFGFEPPAGSVLDRLIIKSQGLSIMQNREAMMVLSATIGVFHLVLANVIVAWRWLGSAHALASVGWVLALLGGWLLALAAIPKPDIMTLVARWFGGAAENWGTTLDTCGWWMLGAGLGLVFLFSSVQPICLTSPRAWLLRCFDGLMGLTGVSKAFGDTLSYLRLFALGLASAQLAITFNQLASDASQIQGVGVLLGLLIFLLGHTLNLLLAVVGGVVHGLRLNCIEFFSWSLTDEGQPFEAFAMRREP